MKVGDLVKRADTTRFGIITKNEKQPIFDHWGLKFWVEWASDDQGWYYADELEVISESR